MIIEIDKDSIPYTFDIDIVGEVFGFEVNYNNRFDFFTVDLYKDDELIIAGEKIVYGKELFSTINDERLPKAVIIPIDPSGFEEIRVGWDQLGVSVFLEVGVIDE